MNQLTFLAFPLFIQQLKILVCSLRYTSHPQGQYNLTRGPFTLRWPASWPATVQSIINYQYCNGRNLTSHHHDQALKHRQNCVKFPALWRDVATVGSLWQYVVTSRHSVIHYIGLTFFLMELTQSIQNSDEAGLTRGGYIHPKLCLVVLIVY